MRFRELVESNGLDDFNVDNNIDIDNSVINALGLIFDTIQEKNLKTEVKLNTVLGLLSNATKLNYTKEDLISAKSRNEAIDNMIKNISPETIEFKSGQDDTNQEELDAPPITDPTEVVGNMAKSAMKRRQD